MNLLSARPLRVLWLLMLMVSKQQHAAESAVVGDQITTFPDTDASQIRSIHYSGYLSPPSNRPFACALSYCIVKLLQLYLYLPYFTLHLSIPAHP